MKELWAEQAAQQLDLELDPTTFNDVERRRLFTDFLANLYEEVGEIGDAWPTYKRHMLLGGASRSGIIDGCVDVVKMAMTIAQLEGVTFDEFEQAFRLKTQVVVERHRQDKLVLQHDTLVFCFDLDDVYADLEPLRAEVGADSTTGGAAAVVALSMQERMKHEFYEGGGFRKLQPVPGAVKASQRIKDKYKALHVLITARPQWRYKRLHADTVYWLNEHKIPYDMLLFSRNKVEAVAEHISPASPVVFVEDHLRNARDLVEAGINVLLFDRPHNQGVDVGQRVKGWSGIEDAIARQLSQRKETA